MSDTPDQIANDIQALADYVADYGLVGMTARIEAFVPRVRALSAHGQPVVDAREAAAELADYIKALNPDCCNASFPAAAAKRCMETITAALTGADHE